MVLRELITLIGFRVNDQELRTAEAKITATANRLIGYGTKMSLAITVPLLGIATLMTKAASDATETQNKFNQVFRGISDDANAWADSFSKSVGRSKFAIQDSLSSYQSMFVGLGFGSVQAANMSKQLQELQIDFSSFNNLSDEEGMQRFVSAMSGSSEVVDRFGINLKQSALDLQLQQMGLAKSTAKATEQQKATARLAIITKAMTSQGAVGDAVRTLGDFANRLRQVRSRIRDVLVGFGNQLVPWLNKLLGAALPVLDWLNNLSESTKRFILVLSALIAAAGPLLVGAGLFLKFLPWIIKMIPVLRVVVLIVTVLALVIEDIMTWIKGGPSLIGMWLGSFEQFKARILPFIALIRQWLTVNLPIILNNILTILKQVVVPAVIETAKAIWETIQPLVFGIRDLAITLWNFIVSLFQRFAPVVQEHFLPIVKALLGYYAVVYGGLLNVVRGAIKLLSGLLMFIGGVFTGNWKAAWQGIKNIFVGIWDVIFNSIKTVLGTLGKVFGLITKILSFGKDATMEAVKAIPSAITTGANVALIAGSSLSATESGLNPERFESIGRNTIQNAQTIQLQPIVKVDVGSVRSDEDAKMVATEVESAVSKVLSQEARKIQASNPEME